MRLTLRFKMFLILAGSSLVLILSMLFFTLSSFEVGIGEYLDDVNEQRMEKLSKRLAQLRLNHGSFDFLEEDPLLAASLEGLLWEGEHENDLMGEIPEDDYEEIEQFYAPIFFIIGNDRELLYGDFHSEDSARYKAIALGDDQFGWLGISETEFGSGSVAYIEAQTREFWFIALLIILVTALAALVSANHLQRKIRPLMEGTRALTKGNYDTRISAEGRDELSELSRDFNQLAETLEQNEQARKQWVEDISHELKTPLTLMGGEIEAIRDGVREMTPATLDLLSQDVNRLNHLVEDLKTLWQSEPGALTLCKQHCDVKSLVEQSLLPFRSAFEDMQIAIDSDLADEVWIDADGPRLSQVFANILANTQRYTDSPGKLKISLQHIRQQCLITIEDSGPGVPEEDLSKIFDRLYRVERSRNRNTGGTGIGLAVCKNIIQAHDGVITASRSSLGGLAISIQLPGGHHQDG